MFKVESFLFKDKFGRTNERYIVAYHNKKYVDVKLLEDIEIPLDEYAKVIHPTGFYFTMTELDNVLEDKLQKVNIWNSLKARIDQLAWLLFQEERKQKFRI